MKSIIKLISILFALSLLTTIHSANAFAFSKTSNSLYWPVDYNAANYKIAGLDYYYSGGYHSDGKAIDLYGTTVYAIADGTISKKSDICSHVGKGTTRCTTCNWGMGNYLLIKHDDGTYSRYIHLKQDSLTSKKVGARVNGGEKIALVGSSGNSSGAHLHFEIYSKYSDKSANRVKEYAFDYYKDRTELQKKFVFRDSLQTESKKYGTWIKANYTKKNGSYWQYSGSEPSAATKYTVTLNAGGGSVSPTSITVTKGSTYGALPTPTRSGYTFSGWFTAASGGTEITSSTAVNLSGNQTLYAQWKTASSAACEHPSYDSSGYCTVATCRAEFPINLTTISATTYYAVKDDVPVRARPYAPDTILESLKKDAAITVVGSGKNSAGNLWYKLSDGNWIFSDNLTDEKPAVVPSQSNAPSASSVKYYPQYKGSSNSIVDALKSIGVNSSFDHRAKIAAANSISNYSGTSAQNNNMLKLLKSGKLKMP